MKKDGNLEIEVRPVYDCDKPYALFLIGPHTAEQDHGTAPGGDYMHLHW